MDRVSTMSRCIFCAMVLGATAIIAVGLIPGDQSGLAFVFGMITGSSIACLGISLATDFNV